MRSQQHIAAQLDYSWWTLAKPERFTATAARMVDTAPSSAEQRRGIQVHRITQADIDVRNAERLAAMDDPQQRYRRWNINLRSA